MLIQNCIATKARDIDEQNVKKLMSFLSQRNCVPSMTTPQTKKKVWINWNLKRKVLDKCVYVLT